MVVDYDIVIVGGSAAGVCAAVSAISLKARVALVEPRLLPQWRRCESDLMTFKQLLPLFRQMHQARQLGLAWEGEIEGASIGVTLDRLTRWASGVASNWSEMDSPAVLSAMGVDVIEGSGEFCRQPSFSFVVNGRRLRSHTYLIATGSQRIVPNIDGLPETGYLTPETFSYWLKKEQKLPQELMAIGDDPIGVELAQTLARLGSRVTLIVQESGILSQEDPEVARWVQARLEAEGVRVLTRTLVTQTKRIQKKKWVQAGHFALEADDILLATGQRANVKSLNLEAAGVRLDGGIIKTNTKLQTTNPRIYACGEALGGYSFEQINQYEAKVALKNALFLPLFSVNYSSIPWAICSDPALARVGLTEPQARRRYGEEIVILRQPFKTVVKAKVLGETTGFCKVILRPNGELLGVHIVSLNAEPLIHPFALAIQEGLKIESMADLVPIYTTFSDIYRKIGARWSQVKIERNKILTGFMKSWSSLRRS